MIIQTAYGIIDDKELIKERIPYKPFIDLPNEAKRLYDPFFDEQSSPISIMLDNKKMIKLKSNTKIKIKDILWIRAGNSIHKIKIPTRLDPRLAYLTGYLYGDGGFKDIRRSYNKNNRFEHRIIVGDEFKIQIERIRDLFEGLFNLQTKISDERIKKGENMYYINPTCKIVYRFFVKFFEFPEGPKKRINIPKRIKDSPHEIKKWFLRGFIDADGDTRATEYYKDRKLPSARIKIRLADKGMVEDLKEELNKEFDLRLTGPYTDRKNDWYIQCSKQGMINAYNHMLFTHPIKRWRLNKFVERFK